MFSTLHVPLIDITSPQLRVLVPFDTLSCLPTFCMLDRFVRPSIEEIKLVSSSLDFPIVVSDVL